MEAFYSTLGKPYTYGSGGFERTYNPEPMEQESVLRINKNLTSVLEVIGGPTFELCFLNRYMDQRDHLGWHADDSPEIDASRPIAVVTFGAEREIWFKPQYCHICKSTETQLTGFAPFCSAHPGEYKAPVTKVLLQHGSLLVMPAGYQQSHYHRIPKSDRVCGERISLTYRGANLG
jgi:alkylated DNA repair dioxygenase AlkB